MPSLSRRVALALPFLGVAAAKMSAFAQAFVPGKAPPGEWHAYARDNGGTRYSPLSQIDATNFDKLEVAWRFKTDMLAARKEFQFEGTPLMIGGIVYCTAGARRETRAAANP